MTLTRIAPLALAALLLNACSFLVPDAERVEIQQGNLLTPEDIARLETGQTRDRVRQLIGDPILSSPFRSNRWDYVYYRTEAGRVVEKPQRLTLYFDERDRVSSVVNRYQPPQDPLPDDADGQPLPSVDTHRGSSTQEPSPQGPGYPDY